MYDPHGRQSTMIFNNAPLIYVLPVHSDRDVESSASSSNTLPPKTKLPLHHHPQNVPRHSPSCFEPALVPFKSIKKPKKMVRFDESRNLAYNNPYNLSEDDCLEFWLTSDEILSFKAYNAIFATTITRAKSSSPYSYRRVLQRIYEGCCRCRDETPTTLSNFVTQDDDMHLKQWFDTASSLVGIERKAVKEIARDRYYRRDQMIDLVMEIQNTDSTLVDNETKREFMRSSCASMSRPARMLARHLAQAHAASVPTDHHYFDLQQELNVALPRNLI